jgi:hypothetical protein
MNLKSGSDCDTARPQGLTPSRIVGSTVSFGLHAALGAVMLWPAAAPRQRPIAAAAAPAQAVEIFVVPEPVVGADPGLTAFSAGHELFEFRREEGASALPLPGFTFDFTRVADRAALLFPFLSPGLSLDAFGLAPQRNAERRLYNPLSQSRTDAADRAKPPLTMTDARLQAILDQSWSRRDRWTVFDPVRSAADAYSPQEGLLPTLFQRYVQQNSLQPYADTDMRDPRLWAQLGLASDHVAFIGFISRYASEHPSTRATTELLFLLDKLAQASFDCLVTLLDIDPAEDLRWTGRQSRDAYRLVTDLQRYYRAQLERRLLHSPDALRTYYDKARLTVLTELLRTTPDGYRAADARFLIGSIHWRHGDAPAALQAWRKIAVDPTDSYVRAYSDVLSAITESASHDDPAFKRRIERVLDAERGRWRDFSYTRLRHFGYRFDTY